MLVIYLWFTESADVFETRKHTRSKLECATMCYADKKCMTAVYRTSGDCLFIKNFANTLIYEDSLNSYRISDEILEMRSRTPKKTLVSASNVKLGMLCC